MIKFKKICLYTIIIIIAILIIFAVYVFLLSIDVFMQARRIELDPERIPMDDEVIVGYFASIMVGGISIIFQIIAIFIEVKLIKILKRLKKSDS